MNTSIKELKKIHGEHYLCYMVSEGMISPEQARKIVENKIFTETKKPNSSYPSDEKIETDAEAEESLKNCVVERIFKLGVPNSKIGHPSFSLRAGWTCPYAKSCFSKAVMDKKTGRMHVETGPETETRCFAASGEAYNKVVYLARLHNEELAKKLLKEGGIPKFVEILEKTFEANRKLVYTSGYFRLHVGGDFFNQQYYNAWVEFINSKQDLIFYAYTKSTPYIIANPEPHNLKIVHSLGGNFDSYLLDTRKKFVAVIWKSEDVLDIQSDTNIIKDWQYVYDDGSKSMKYDLPIDHDDSNAYLHDNPYALLIHGTQAPNSIAGEALKIFKKRSVKYAYTRLKKHKIKRDKLIKIVKEEIYDILESIRK